MRYDGPFGGGYSRFLKEYTAPLGPNLLPTLQMIVAQINATSVLEIGCGETIALQEAVLLLESLQAQQSFASDVCAAGINSLEHALLYAYKNNRTAMARDFAEGHVIAGNVSRSALLAAAQRRGMLTAPRATPVVKHSDFRLEWPFMPGTFDLILSNAAIQKLKYPDIELNSVLDEALRVLRTGGVAFLDIVGAHQHGKDAGWRAHGLPELEMVTAAVPSMPGAGYPRAPTDARWKKWVVHERLKCGRGHDLCVPIEVALGIVGAPRLVDTPSCSSNSTAPSRFGRDDHVASHDHEQHKNFRHPTRCALSYYFGTKASSYLLIHTFAPVRRGWKGGEVTINACKEAAFASPTIGPALQKLNGTFQVEANRSQLMRVLEERSTQLHAARARGDSDVSNAFRLPSIPNNDRRIWAEAYATAVRSWLRSSTWSHLRTFQLRWDG